jgi:hypothetical protein
MVQQDETQAPARTSFYDRLGGVYNIAPVVMSDPRLNANPRVDEAHHRVSAAGFKYFVTEMLCQAAGRTAAVLRSVDGGLPPAPHDHRRRMAGLHGRPATDAGEVRATAAGAGRSESDRGEHTGGDRDCSTADVKGYAIGSC